VNNEEKIYNLLEKIYIELQDTKTDVANIKNDLSEVKSDTSVMKNEIITVKDTVVRIENDHGHKLGALFDGYKQNAEKLNSIEIKVAKHEEIILRRVR
jgi:hypothetical protein